MRFVAMAVLAVAVLGIAMVAFPASASAATRAPVYRFYNLQNGSHFYTASADERDTVIATYSVYKFEGAAYTINTSNPDNSAPLYRFYNKKNGSHFYTVSASERDTVIATWPDIYSYDGPAYNVCATNVTGSTPVYRFYNVTNGSHFYTASDTERDAVIANWPNVYRYEGPAFWLANNTVPVAANDAYNVGHDTVLTVSAGSGVLVNDTDADGDTLSAYVVTTAAHGTLSLAAAGSFTYTPTTGYVGADTFTYKANDGTADSNVVTVTITVSGVNQAPVAVNDAYTVGQGTTLTVPAVSGVLANDTDADGNILTAAVVSGLTDGDGTLTLAADGSFTYRAPDNNWGHITFTYKVNDGLAESNVATVTLTVTIAQETVTFDANGGSGAPSPIVVDYHSKIGTPSPDPTRTGYTFSGWYTAATGGVQFDFTNTSIVANITLYAHWTVNSYTITFESNGGSAVGAITLDYGSAVASPTPDPTREEYTFAGWYSDAGLTTPYTFSTMPAASITLYAKWDMDI
ncbi:MAG: tandem-95 repeat protein [Coriobacteriia bacterium]|nr:tandem-95 repeat protein [Coriobacteriia bacterium]